MLVPLGLAVAGIVVAVTMPAGTGTLLPTPRASTSFSHPLASTPTQVTPQSAAPPQRQQATAPTPTPTTAHSSTSAGASTGATYDQNMLLGSQSTFDEGLGGWAATAPAAAASVATPVMAGTGALRITNTSSQAATLTALSGTGPGSWTAATGDDRWFGNVYLRAGSKTVRVGATIRFLDAQGALIASSVGQLSTNTTGGYTKTWQVTGLAPSNTSYVVLVVTLENVQSHTVQYLDNASLVTKRSGAKAVRGPLHTVGNRIVDVNGRTVILRGFNRAGLEGVDTELPTADDISHTEKWGANFIRLPLGEQFWLSSSCHYDPTYASKVGDAVNLITALGMVALLDLHWNTRTPCGTYGQQPMADYPGALTFWKQVAARYMNNPLVAFDLYNEPHDISDAIWRNGGSITWKGQTYKVAGMQQMYDAVRSTGAQNLVFVTGQAWGNLPPRSVGPVDGFNLVYAVHAYTCVEATPPTCTNKNPYDPKQFFQWWTEQEKTFPIVVTEFGWPNPEDGLYIRNVIAYAVSHGWGWAVYTWGVGGWGPFAMHMPPGPPGTTYQPRPAGQPVLAAFPGA